jgi:hypothetical protein
MIEHQNGIITFCAECRYYRGVLAKLGKRPRYLNGHIEGCIEYNAAKARQLAEMQRLCRCGEMREIKDETDNHGRRSIAVVNCKNGCDK